MSIVTAAAPWTVLLAVALLWPSHLIGPLDGAPLDRPLEAVAIGLVMPWLAWLGRDAFRRRPLRLLVLTLLLWKAATTAFTTQQGLCATFTAPHPLTGLAFNMRIEEPRGLLRSWDLRADLWADDPRCTAIVTRPLRATEEFPAWFVNITDQMVGRRDLVMAVRGAVTTGGATTRPIDLFVPLGREAWTFDPTIDGRSVWEAPLVTVSTPSILDRWLARWAWLVTPAIVLALTGLLLQAAIKPLLSSPQLLAAVAVTVTIAVAIAASSAPALHRLAGATALIPLLLRIPADKRTASVAVWLIGAPWLAFFAAWSVDLAGRWTAYSMDDWLAYQIAGYRIYMNGFWIEGGSTAFLYQPLYRWITGALHLVFGDSSVGEVYWDASCLLLGAVVAFQIVARRASWRWALAAAALTLTTLTAATPWHLIGRGLSEISAAGFGFAAVLALLRAQDESRTRWIVAAAAMAALMFYARLNHLLWAPLLVAMLVPLTTGSDVRSMRRAFMLLPWRRAALYWLCFAVAVLAFMLRTKYFTGVFSLFHGTSLRFNDTGLRPWTLFDADVWIKIGHSLTTLIFMNDPPHPDIRAIIVAAGVAIVLLSLLQVPILRQMPAALLLVTCGGMLGAFLAHAHGYPGRFTVHLIPFTSAVTAIAASTITSGFTGNDWRVSHNNGT